MTSVTPPRMEQPVAEADSMGRVSLFERLQNYVTNFFRRAPKEENSGVEFIELVELVEPAEAAEPAEPAEPAVPVVPAVPVMSVAPQAQILPLRKNPLLILAPYNDEVFKPAQIINDNIKTEDMQTVRFYNLAEHMRVPRDRIVYRHNNLMGLYVYYLDVGGVSIGKVIQLGEINEFDVPEVLFVENEYNVIEMILIEEICGIPCNEILHLLYRMVRSEPINIPRNVAHPHARFLALQRLNALREQIPVETSQEELPQEEPTQEEPPHPGYNLFITEDEFF